MNKLITTLLVVIITLNPAQFIQGQTTKPLSPQDTVLQFYDLLRKKKFNEAFQLSVYSQAIEKLSPEQMKELEPDFLAMSAAIPEKIELSGEQITGTNATVYMKVTTQGLHNDENLKKPKQDQLPINLISVNGKWIVGDKETQELVTVHGNQYFLLDRAGVFQQMQANEVEIYDLMNTLSTVEVGYARTNQGMFATLEELLLEKIITDQVGTGKMFGYIFDIEVSQDKRKFSVYAVPEKHNITGRYSYYADENGVKLEKNGGVKLVPSAKSVNKN